MNKGVLKHVTEICIDDYISGAISICHEELQHVRGAVTSRMYELFPETKTEEVNSIQK